MFAKLLAPDCLAEPPVAPLPQNGARRGHPGRPQCARHPGRPKAPAKPTPDAGLRHHRRAGLLQEHGEARGDLPPALHPHGCSARTACPTASLPRQARQDALGLTRRRTGSSTSPTAPCCGSSISPQAGLQAEIEDHLLPVAVTFLYGQGDLAKDFTPTLDPASSAARTTGWSSDPRRRRRSTRPVAGRGSRRLPRQESIIQSVDNLNAFAFSNIRLNDAART